MKVLVAD
jgi:D-3-phosphoglycerate dehydrogenase / 2-oxoglutarate reductase